MENLTIEDKIFGRTEPKPLTEMEKTALTKAVKYKIRLVNIDNTSIMDGEAISVILSLEAKDRLRAGEKKIEAGGFIIERIDEVISKTETTTLQDKTIAELKAYAKEHNIDVVGLRRKDDLIERIERG